MEVHHHTHPAHGKKTWKEYFWEFLMLFLAVFCGFLAEYQLEHKIEKERTRQLARNLYAELYSDSINVQQANEFRLTKEKSIAVLRHFISDSNLSRPSKEFFLAFHRGLYMRLPSVFEPIDIVLEQMKNSGALRYFNDDSLQKKIGELSVAIANVRRRNDREDVYFNQNLVPFVLKHYDQDWHDSMTHNGILNYAEGALLYEQSTHPYIGSFKNPGLLNKEEAKNMLMLYREILQNTRQIVYDSYSSLNKQVLALLRKKFKIK